MTRYLEHIDIGCYGALSDYRIGSFGPGMNVVYGPNEAGKSTIASFIGGVLFGWEEARGVRNTYRPQEGERSGALSFAETGSTERFVLARERNEEGLKGDAWLVADIDRSTYRTMFSLSSDELRSLRMVSDVTASLLAVESGTESSPSIAYDELDCRIAAKTAGVGEGSDSIAGLVAQIEAKRAEIEAARAANELCKHEDRERANLAESRAASAARLDELNDEIEEIHAARARVEILDAQAQQRKEELDALKSERLEYQVARGRETEVSPELTALDGPSERLLRDRVEEYADELAKAQRAVDVAKEDSASSAAAYEALLEVDEEAAVRERSLESRRPQTILSVLFPIVFIVAGVPLLVHGVGIRSLSFVALGAGLVVLACFLAAAALAVALRPNKGAEALEARRKDAQWIMLQDKKKLEANLTAKRELEEEIAAFFESAGLGMANGSIRQARALLDEAHEGRARVALLDQRLASLDIRAEAAREALDEAIAERSSIAESVGLAPDVSVRSFDSLLRQRSELREELSQAYEEMSLRYGELGQRLESARADFSFDRVRLEYQELQCRLRESKRELVTLLLARRMLGKSIAVWESRSQPEVYANASRLFALLTGGAWTKVSMTGEGSLIATSADGFEREVRHLSLGTCQQLYLALRVAMLLKADTVGTSIPVIADDVFVNFDASRRRAAACAFAELAAKRQVIVFTCHRETVSALREAASDATFIEL